MKPKNNFKSLPIPARFVIVAFGLAGILSAGWAMFSGAAPHYGRLVLLVLLGAVTAHAKVKLSKTSTLSLLTSAIMLSLMMEGIIAAVAVGVTGVTVQAFLPSRKFVVHRLVFNAAMVVLAIHAASFPYYWVISQNLAVTLLSELLGIVAASLTYYLGNSMSVALIVAVTECKSAFRVWCDHFLTAAPAFLGAGMISLVLGKILATTILGAAILMPLLYISHRSVQLAGKRAPAASR